MMTELFEVVTLHLVALCYSGAGKNKQKSETPRVARKRRQSPEIRICDHALTPRRGNKGPIKEGRRQNGRVRPRESHKHLMSGTWPLY